MDSCSSYCSSNSAKYSFFYLSFLPLHLLLVVLFHLPLVQLTINGRRSTSGTWITIILVEVGHLPITSLSCWNVLYLSMQERVILLVQVELEQRTSKYTSSNISTTVRPSSISFSSTTSSISGTIASSSGATYYEWRRGTSGSWNYLGGSRSFTDYGLAAGTYYRYQARAGNTAGASGIRQKDASTQAASIPIPSTPNVRITRTQEVPGNDSRWLYHIIIDNFSSYASNVTWDANVRYSNNGSFTTNWSNHIGQLNSSEGRFEGSTSVNLRTHTIWARVRVKNSGGTYSSYGTDSFAEQS